MRKRLLASTPALCLAAALALFESGCASQTTADGVASSTYSHSIAQGSEIVGPQMLYGSEQNDEYGYFLLRLIKRSDGKPEAPLLDIDNAGRQPMNFSRAEASGGRTLDVVAIHSTFLPLSANPFHEIVTLRLPLDLIAAHENDGLSVQVYGQRGLIYVPVPGYYLQGFMSRVRQ